ncbi:hypothetical protein H2248_010250 [Termitomyces sp. 'cryptogamus']|nr:hypothetical protein H2248_010250 [Termitomyces sp. 'cryptogamus']
MYNDMPPLIDLPRGRRPGFIPPPPAAHFDTGGQNLFSGAAQANSGWVPPTIAPFWQNYGPPLLASPWAAGTGAVWRSAPYRTLFSHSNSTPGPFWDQYIPVATDLPAPVTDVPRSRSMFTFILARIYLTCLFNLPTLYISRVDEIFEEVQQSKLEIQKRTARGARNMPVERTERTPFDIRLPSVPPTVGPWGTDFEVMDGLMKSWGYFIGSLIGEWQTLNMISVLLSAAILTTLQVDGAATDPYTRFSALLALVCSLMSLLYGSIYIMRFNTMRRTRKVVEWAERARKTTQCIWWNIWVLLALPGIWFSWSFILYLISVMTFVWRTGTTDVVPQIKPLTALGPRIAITCILVLGLIYLLLVIREFRQYGDGKRRNTLYGLKKTQQDDDPSKQQQIVVSEESYPQPAKRPGEMPSPTHTAAISVTSDEAKLPTQKVPRSDAPLKPSQHGLRPEFDYDSLGGRSNDWRSDDRVQKTFFSRVQRLRSKIERDFPLIIHCRTRIDII